MTKLDELRKNLFSAVLIFEDTKEKLNAIKDKASLVWDITIHEALVAHKKACEDLDNAKGIYNAAVRTANGEVF